eukprot:scaffold159069_cov22-Tisochrysis_lutea.AAC.1
MYHVGITLYHEFLLTLPMKCTALLALHSNAIYQTLRSLRPVTPSQMMSMLPGFNSDIMPQGNDKASQQQLRRFITIIGEYRMYPQVACIPRV